MKVQHTGSLKSEVTRDKDLFLVYRIAIEYVLLKATVLGACILNDRLLSTSQSSLLKKTSETGYFMYLNFANLFCMSSKSEALFQHIVSSFNIFNWYHMA